MLNTTVCLLCLCLVSCKSDKHAPSQKQPNVLFISVDDLNDWVGNLNGHKLAITPNLDRLAKKGVLFTNAHANMPVCVASRNSILSGLHPATSGWYSLAKDHKDIAKYYNRVMSGKKMLPAFFKSNGYDTYCAGKVFHKGATDISFLMDSLWNDVMPGYGKKLRKIDYERGQGYGGDEFYPFPKNGSALKKHYGDKLKSGHSLCGGPLDKEDIPGGKMYDELIADYAIRQIEQEHSKPFFIAAGFVRPHVPYTAPRQYFDMYDIDSIEVPEIPVNEMNDISIVGKSIAFNYGVSEMGDFQAVKGMGTDYWKQLVHSYLACVTFVDDQIGRVLDALENSGYENNTVIVLWSDHGQSFGEKMNFRKMSLWEESTRVPLYIVQPAGKTQGAVCEKPVSLLDIYPTLVDLCDLPNQNHLEGHSLKKLLENPKQDWEYPALISWRYKNFAVKSEAYKYIQYRDGSEELYDYKNDPGEHINLVNNIAYKDIIERHKKWIPENPALPVGLSKWKGDEIDLRIKEWEENDSIPFWLN